MLHLLGAALPVAFAGANCTRLSHFAWGNITRKFVLRIALEVRDGTFGGKCFRYLIS